MHGLKTGFEYPAELFAALKKNLAIKKGALLLPENDTGVFAPWSIAGFDKTTQRRMRIAPDLAYGTLGLTEAKTLLTDLNEARNFASCFSSREAALAEHLLVCFFTSRDKITGILLVADSPWLFLDDSLLCLAFTVIAELASLRLAQARSARLYKRRDHGYMRKDRFLASLRAYAAELPAGTSLDLFTVDAKFLVASIRESNPDIDEYRVVQDIAAVIATLLAGSPVFSSSRRKKILAATGKGQFN
ncbi:MAG: hypothetical protein FWG35_06200, partial [Spirochaetaceae bacterium]|nr:hypothetical protein [Spirochaetaceae bacterium]